MKKEFKYKKTRILFSVLGILLFLVVAFVIFWKEFFSQNTMGFVTGFILLFSLFFLIIKMIELCIILFRKTPAIIITDKYLIDNSHHYSFGKIPWENVTNLNLVTTSSGKKYIELHVDNAFSKSIKLNLFQKTLLWFDHFGNQSMVYLRDTFVECNMEEIASVYSNFCENSTQKNL